MVTCLLPEAQRRRSYYWDPDADASGNATSGAGLGGTGVWNTSNSVWWNGSTDVAWPNLLTDTATFDGTTGTVTLDVGINANSLVFRRSGYLLTGGDLTLAGVAPSIRVSMLETATINSLLKGSSGFTKTGGGMLRIGNALNSYTGTTTINNGAIVIADGGALGNNSLANPDAIVVTGSGTQGTAGGVLVLEGGYNSGVTLNRTLSLQGLGPTPAATPVLRSSACTQTLSPAASARVPPRRRFIPRVGR
ncbi:MAG: autotransporter-associated beta strand repeat-containing protein [Pirellulales bacterium]